jgi:hypothetical protein
MSLGVPWDHEKFESALLKEISLRKDIRPCPSFCLWESRPPFEQFLWFGPTRQHPLHVVAAFPAVEIFETSISKIVWYCYPTGVSRRHLRGVDHGYLADQFAFQIATGSRVLYGVCLHAYADCASVFPYAVHLGYDRICFCLCVLTTTPALAFHFAFLEELAGVIASQGSVARSMPEPPVLPEGKPIPHLVVERGFGAYRRLTVPEGLAASVVSLYGELNPPEFEVDSALSTSLGTLFSLLDPEDVLAAVGYVMLDAQIVVIGTSLQEITMVVFALVSLIRPFTFAGTVIPVLPNSEAALQTLQLPTPFLSGCVSTDELAQIHVEETVVRIDLDARKIHAKPGLFPPFPRDGEGELLELLKRPRSSTEKPGFPGELPGLLGHTLDFGTETAEEIARAVLTPLDTVLSDGLICFFVTDISEAAGGITVFNRELFRATAPPEHGPFFEQLMDAMTFQSYIEDRIGQFMLERDQGARPLRLGPMRLSSGSLGGGLLLSEPT